MKKERESNFELMRLVSMLMIVVWHIIVHGNLLNNGNPTTQFLIKIIMGILVVHVNSLVFVTGYFNANKMSITKKKCLKIIGEAWFYKALIAIVLILTKKITITKILLIEELLPLDFNNYWFINCYLVIYILSPYLNKVTKNMPEEEYSHFILILIGLLCVLPIISQGRIVGNSGSTIINFTILYYLGSYFRKYPLKDNYHFKNLTKEGLQIFLVASFFTIMIMNVSLNCMGDILYGIDSKSFKYIGKILLSSFAWYSNPLVIVQSCIYCLLFETLKIKNKIINFLATSTFGVYLIHDNHLMRKIIYKWVPKVRSFSTMKSIGTLLLSSITMFFICLSIEIIRRALAKLVAMIYNKGVKLIKQSRKGEVK